MVLLTNTMKGSTVKIFYNFLIALGLFSAVNFLPAPLFSLEWWVGTVLAISILFGIEGIAREVTKEQNK